MKSNSICVPVKGGTLVATASTDPNYPGIDVEFVADNDTGEFASRPRVLIEKTDDFGLRALVWNDKNSEDYTESIEFNYPCVNETSSTRES